MVCSASYFHLLFAQSKGGLARLGPTPKVRPLVGHINLRYRYAPVHPQQRAQIRAKILLAEGPFYSTPRVLVSKFEAHAEPVPGSLAVEVAAETACIGAECVKWRDRA